MSRIDDDIIAIIKKEGAKSGSEIARILGISRQAVNKHLILLIEGNKVKKTGKTRAAKYILYNKKRTNIKYKKRYIIKGLKEHKVFNEISMILNVKNALNNNVFDIFEYGFTEMLNNAIEHSHSSKCDVLLELNQYKFTFAIRDYGIGIFESIKNKFNLNTEIDSIGLLIKGKLTTLPDSHSGEGIFFTSKSSDYFKIRSHSTTLIFDNNKKDIFIERSKKINGTGITFTVRNASRKALKKIFDEFASEKYDFKFSKTKIYVKLLSESFISRSEARRLLIGTDKFKEIILDFKGVKIIGQGFADEIFNIYKNLHPDIIINIENANSEINEMIKHVS